MSASNEPVFLAAYDPEWPRRFAEERDVLEKVLAPWIAGTVEHIGSTAIVGLRAKPIIDIMAGVGDLQSSSDARRALEDLSYHYFPYRADVMHWFCKPSPLKRTHHLHLVPFESRLWRDRLAFRDHLRANPRVAQEYSDLKAALAEQHRDDREAYTAAKGPFVERVIRQALSSRDSESPPSPSY